MMMKTKSILTIGFSSAFLLLLILSATALIIIDRNVASIDQIVHINNAKVELISTMRNAARERTVILQKMLLLDDAFSRDTEWLKLNSAGSSFAKARLALLQHPLSREEKALLETQGIMSAEIAPLQLKIADMIIDGNTRQAKKMLLLRAIPDQNKVFEVLTMLAKFQASYADSIVLHAATDYRWAVSIVLVFTFTVAALFFYISLYTVHKTTSAEQSLRIEKDIAETTLYSIADGVITTDAEGFVTQMNEVAQDYTGWKMAEAVGSPLQKICVITSESDRNQTTVLLDAVLHKKLPVHLNKYLYLLQKDSQRISVEGSIAPIGAKNQDITGTVLVLRDVSQRITAEGELRSYKENLESLVEDRTKALVEVNKNLESFSYSISNDLRAPLRGINGFSHALLEDFSDKLDEQGKSYLNRIVNGTERIGNLVDDLLELSRVSSGDINKDRIDLSSIANEIATLLEEKHATRNVQWEIADGMVDQADESLMWVLLENLMENAWKYTARRSMASIKFSSIKEDNQVVYFVKDNGVGFDMSYYNKLFGTFERLDQGANNEGAGIGLATVKKIVGRHGGKVWADGSLNKGATFYFTLDNHFQQFSESNGRPKRRYN
ncbi:MAG: ATP-binding protein [Thiohalomonadales bacterium]